MSYSPKTEASEIDNVSRISAANAEAGDRRVDGGKRRCSKQNACWSSISEELLIAAAYQVYVLNLVKCFNLSNTTRASAVGSCRLGHNFKQNLYTLYSAQQHSGK